MINDNITFEEAIKKLELILNDLDKNNVSLDDAIDKYSEGVNLIKYCNDCIEKAEQKIHVISSEDNVDG